MRCSSACTGKFIRGWIRAAAPVAAAAAAAAATAAYRLGCALLGGLRLHECVEGDCGEGSECLTMLIMHRAREQC